MNLSNQKNLAARVMGIGINRVYFNPESASEISEALTRDDIKHLISIGAIAKKPKHGISRGRHNKKVLMKKKGKRKGHGHRSGTKKARNPKKEAWIKKIRAIRDELKKMLNSKEIDRQTYSKIYRQAKGNLFHSRRHMREHIQRTKK